MYHESNLEEWAEIIRNEIKIQDFQNGWFGKHKRCCIGEDIFDRVVSLLIPDKKNARNLC